MLARRQQNMSRTQDVKKYNRDRYHILDAEKIEAGLCNGI